MGKGAPPGWRPKGPDRRLASMHDWYGIGVLRAIFEPAGDVGVGGVRYTPRRVVDDQYTAGFVGLRVHHNIDVHGGGEDAKREGQR